MLIVVEISLRYQCFVRTSLAKQIIIFAIKLHKLTLHHIQKEKILQIRNEYTYTYTHIQTQTLAHIPAMLLYAYLNRLFTCKQKVVDKWLN